MIEIDSQTYDNVAERLAEKIGDKDYYSGSVRWDCPEYDSELTATLVVYHSTCTAPDRSWNVISDVVPIWWTFSTLTDTGEALNDFDFGEIKRRLTTE